MTFVVVFLPESEEDLEKLDTTIRTRCLKKIEWLSHHPELLGDKPLKTLPHDLKGLCSYPVGDWRILYWAYPQQKVFKIYGIEHRSKVYKHL